MNFIDELKRRNVIKATIAYIVVAWVLLQVLTSVLPNFETPPWVLKTLLFLIAIGLPVWVIFSWVYEITPEGLKKTVKVSKDQSITEATNRRLNIIIIITLIIAIAVSFVNRPMPGTPSKIIVNNELMTDNSIAVIPFKNLSGNIENQYFADGMMDDILNHLSIIRGLEVKSRQSSEKYRESEKSIPQIGDELGVNYLLEGSVQKHKDSIRIIVQLIDAINDNHLWSDKYDFELKNVFTIQSEISKQIAIELNTVISPAGIEEIEKKPTENLEAYNFYLNGRFFWHLRTEKDLNKSIYYFNKAVELDSTYSLAYAGLADSYFIMAFWGWIEKNEGFTNGKEFAQKALTINNNIAEAHATLGGIKTWYEWNWKDAESELKLAISLNPNNATAHQYYAELLDILGRNKEAREQINLALKLNPHSYAMNLVSAICYNNSKDYYKAIEAYKKTIDLANSNNDLILGNKLSIMKCYLNLGRNKDAFELLKDFIPINNHQLLDKIFEDSGIKGVINWYINWILVDKQNKNNNYTIAMFYSFIGDSQNALKYLEYFSEDGQILLPKINNSSDFNAIKTEPRFIAILKKMGLEDYE
ncbi:tetratricopeptide repeat protein [Eudoraea sp.]|uniref:tetratricopeptide repeat protein n=1 Tax=Eudoraea sp. TaxID=1979955 RepID=UPI003C717845